MASTLLLGFAGVAKSNQKNCASVAELADALDLGSSGETRAGSIPVTRNAEKTLINQGFLCKFRM